MRVLSRRSNLREAVACGYSEGAGFVVLTEPSPSLLPAFGKFAPPRQNPHVLPLGFGSTHPEGGSIGFG